MEPALWPSIGTSSGTCWQVLLLLDWLPTWTTAVTNSLTCKLGETVRAPRTSALQVPTAYLSRSEPLAVAVLGRQLAVWCAMPRAESSLHVQCGPLGPVHMLLPAPWLYLSDVCRGNNFMLPDGPPLQVPCSQPDVAGCGGPLPPPPGAALRWVGATEMACC